MYGYLNGFKKLEEIMKHIIESNENHFIAFSDGFINDSLPKPIIAPYKFEYSELKNSKEYKKTEFINAEFLVNSRKNLNDKDIFYNWLKKKPVLKDEAKINNNKSITTTENILKNSVNRLTGTTYEGQLYNSEETYFDPDKVSITLYVKYNDDIIKTEEVNNIISLMGELGFGKDASTGKGKYKIDGGNSINEEPDELKYFEGANAFMTLSHGIPLDKTESESDCELNYGKIITKFPKHGGFLSNGDYFKNPFIVYKPGSTFLISDANTNNIKEIYGKALNNISRHGGSHIQGTFLFPFFIKI
jgi:CRISPR-associated protein Csm4